MNELPPTGSVGAKGLRKMHRAKNRKVIQPKIAARIMYDSDRTCCVCQMGPKNGKQVQIHHIDDDPSNNEVGNLAVLCWDCHNETQIRGGFHRKLDAEQIILYRDNWLRTVLEQRKASAQRGGPISVLPEQLKPRTSSPELLHKQNTIRAELPVTLQGTSVETFSSLLDTLVKLLETGVGSSKQINDLLGLLTKLVKEWVRKRDSSAVDFATKELFTGLYKFSQPEGPIGLRAIFSDLFGYAYSEMKQIHVSMIWVFNSIMLDAWAPEHDLEKAEKATEIILRLGIEALDHDLSVAGVCADVIDNLAGDMFESRILAKQIILACYADQLGKDGINTELTDFAEELIRCIKINDQFAWEANIKTYLIDSMDYAITEADDYGLDLQRFKEEFLNPALEKNIDEQIEGYVDFLQESKIEDEDLSFETAELIDIVTSYEPIRSTIADGIRKRILEKNDSNLQKRFDDIVRNSKILIKIYQGSAMITTFDELAGFLDVNSDTDNVGIGATAFGPSVIRFARVLMEEERKELEEIARKYDIHDGVFELSKEEMLFEMDRLVYLGNEQHDMRKLTRFLRDVNCVAQVRYFSAGLSFNLRSLRG